MLPLSVALFGLLTTTIASFFISRIFVATLDRLDDTEDEKFIEVGKQTLASLWDVVIVSFYLFVLGAIGLFVHLVTFWYIYMFFGILTIPAEAYARDGHKINSSLDAAFTSKWVPFFRSVILLLFDVINVLCEVFLCVYNAFAIASKALIGEFLRVATACDEMNWGALTLALARTGEEFMLSLAEWILSFFSEEFQLTPALDQLSHALFQLNPLLTCECQMLDFVWQLALGFGDPVPSEPGSPQIPGIFTSPSLRHALDRFLNFLIAIVVDVVSFGIELLESFVGAPIIKAITIGEDPDRPPRLIEARDNLCLTLIHLGDWLDDIFAVIMKVFFSVDRKDVPPFGPILANPLCSIVSWMQMQTSAIFHIDVLIAQNYWETLQEDFDPFFGHLYNTSTAMENFWNTWDDEITNDIGCFLANTINATVAPFDATFRSVIGILDLIDSPDDILPFLKTDRVSGTLDRGINASEHAIDCAAALITHINDPLGRLFNETGHVLKNILLTTKGLLFNLPKFLEYIRGDIEPGEFKANVVNTFFELRATAIAVGNVVRQFNIIGTCPLENPHANPLTSAVSGPPVSQNVDVFCCGAAATEGFLRVIIELLRMVFVSLIVVIEERALGSDFGEILLEVLVVQRTADITLELIPSINATIYGALCYSFGGLPIIMRFIDAALSFPEFFACEPGEPRLWEAFWRAISEFFAFLILAQIEVVAIVLQLIPFLIVAPDDGPGVNLCSCVNGVNPCDVIDPFDGPCGCGLALKIYDAWVGRLMTFIRSLGRFITCFTKIAFISRLTEKLYEFFGVDGDNTIRGFICDIIHAIGSIIEFLALIIQGKFVEAVTGIILEIPALAKIIESVNAIWNFLVQFSSKAKAYVRCLFTNFFKMFAFIGVCIGSCFTKPIFKCHKCQRPDLSCPALWNDPNPIIIAKRAGDEDFTNDTIEIDFEIDPTSPDSPCREQFLAASSPDARPADRRDFKICMASSSITQIMDLFLFNTNSSDRIVDPMLFYDPFVTFEFIGNTTYGLTETFSYLSNMVLENITDVNRTIADRFAELNVTDRVSIRVGLILEMVVRAMMDEDSKSPALSFATSIWRYGFEVWAEAWKIFKEGDGPAKKDALHEDNPLGHLSSWTMGFSEMVGSTTKTFGVAFGDVKSWWGNATAHWMKKSGFSFQAQHLDSMAYIVNTVRSRAKWDFDGHQEDREPFPLGTITQRKRYEMLQRRIKESQTEDERLHWISVKTQLFPRWDPPSLVPKKDVPISKPALIESDCPGRRCWDDVGNVIGGCDLDRLTCGCTFFDDQNGTCCAGTLCFDNVTALECTSDLNGTFVPGGGNCSSTCEAIRSANSTFGACCTAGSCQLTSGVECDNLNGTWNPRKTCSNSRLSELCDNCRNRNLPDIDITSELFCPIASGIGEVSRQPCEARKCRDDDGNEIATCGVTRDTALGRLQCGCDTPVDALGSCCTKNDEDPIFRCIGLVNASRCDDIASDNFWAWKAGRLCSSCFVDEEIANAGEGACCHGSEDNTTCEITTFEVCVGLDGTFTAGTSCDSPNLSGKCNRCQAEGCRECAWFLAWVNDVTDAVIHCVDDLRGIRDERQNRSIFASDTPIIKPVKTSGSFFMPYDPPAKERPIITRFIDGPSGLIEWIIFIMESVVNWFLSLFGVEGLDFDSLTDSIVNFFTNTDPDDPRGFVFWLVWLVTCDYNEMSRCEEGRQGLGLEKGLLIALISLTLIIGLLFRLWRLIPALISGIVLVIIFVLITLGAAYFYSPSCAINPLRPSPPLIPNCLCEDLNALIRRADVDCLPLCNIACTGNLTCDEFDCECINPTGECIDGRGDCPGEDVDFHREFPKCGAAPYNFDGPFRLFTSAVRRISPTSFCLLAQSDFIAVSWIRSLPGGDVAFDFGEDPCVGMRDFGDRWGWCFWSNFMMWFPLIAFMFIGLVIVFFFLGALIFLIASLVDLIVFFLAFIVSIFARFGRLGRTNEKYYRESRKYEVSIDKPWTKGKGKRTIADTMKAMNVGPSSRSLSSQPSRAATPGGPTGFSFGGRKHPNYKGEEKVE